MAIDDIGDQRAKDLVDRSMDEPPKRAIKTLDRALTYGRTGMYASQAYLELGGQYADIGDIERAIENYGLSLAAWPTPNPMALYWRGELYFQQGKWDKAREDFERAAALGLYSPEREQVGDYLAKIRNNQTR